MTIKQIQKDEVLVLRSILNIIHDLKGLVKELPSYPSELMGNLERAYNLAEEQLKEVVWIRYLEDNPIEGS